MIKPAIAVRVFILMWSLCLFLLVLGACEATNLLPNSSFELGNRAFGDLQDRRWTGYAMAPVGWQTPTPLNGSACIGGGPIDVTSACFYVSEPGQYTYSFYIRMYNPSQVRANFFANPSDPASPNYLLCEEITPTTSWKRYSFQVNIQGGVGELYYVNFMPHTRDNDHMFWIDGIQLEKGSTATSYNPLKQVEFGLKTDRPYNVFEPGQPISVKVQSYNNGPTASPRLELVARDFRNEVVAQHTFTLAAASYRLTEQEITLPISVRGSIRLELYEENGPVQDELAIAVMPPVAVEDRGVGSQQGQYANSTFATYLGLKYGAGEMCWWDIVQPASSGSWDWTFTDTTVDNCLSQGITFRAVWLLAGQIPQWAAQKPDKHRPWPSAQDPQFDLDDWDNYVRAVVGRYKGKIDSWSVWNEPFYGEVSRYITLLQSTHAAIKSANPQAEVCGADCPPEWYWWAQQFAAQGGLQYLDVFSSHAYENIGGFWPETLGVLKTLASLDGIQRPIYDTETTLYPTNMYTFYTHMLPGSTGAWVNGNYMTWGYPAEEGAARWTKTVITQHAMGLKHVMPHYMLGNGVLPSTQIRGAVEMDGSWTPCASAWAVAGRMVSTATTLGEVKGSPHLRTFLFNKRGTPMAVLWTREYETPQYPFVLQSGLFHSKAEADQRRGISRDIVVPQEHNLRIKLTPGSFTAYDIMGNVVEPKEYDGASILPVSNYPLYIVANGVTIDVVRQALAGANVDDFVGMIPLPDINGSNPFFDSNGNKWTVYQVNNYPNHNNFANYSPLSWQPGLFGHYVGTGALSMFYPHSPSQDGSVLWANASSTTRWGGAYAFAPVIAGDYSLYGKFWGFGNDGVPGLTHLRIGKFNASNTWYTLYDADLSQWQETPDLSTVPSLRSISLGVNDKLVFVVWSDLGHDANLSFCTTSPPGIRFVSGSVADAKKLGNGDFVTLADKVLYLKQGGFGYAEEPDRSSGLRIEGTIPAEAGDSVCLSGIMRVPQGGERYIEINVLRPSGWGCTLNPVGINNRDLRAPLADGLYVRTWGRVKPGSISGNSYLITDGSEGEITVITESDPQVTDGEFITVNGAAGLVGTRVIYAE